MATMFPSSVTLLACLLAMATSLAIAAPVGLPDLTNCQPPDLPSGVATFNCCIANSANITDYQLPPRPSVLRVRRAAHQLDAAYIQKYRRAVALMKNLSSNDPWSFTSQANLHCAYCNGAYDQSGFSGVEFQVHNSWLFLPFHRAYLYFNERILGKLIGDDTFALPFWNWDDSAGMSMPTAYTTDANSSLYDSLRDGLHQPPNTTDLNFNGTDDTTSTTAQMVDQNLKTMYRQIISGAKTQELFFGQPYRGGDAPNPGPGSLETVPHNTVHLWIGDRTQPNVEDMGAFYSAGRDPIFFAHHGNVDRMWDIWANQLNNTNINDTDWLDAQFLFWDENRQLVRIKVRDLLDIGGLGYRYENVPVRWFNSTPNATTPTVRPQITPGVSFPLSLSSAVNVQVARPSGAGSGVEEALVVSNVQVNGGVYSKFDVYINAGTSSALTQASAEFAGSFVHVAMGNGSTVNIQEVVLGLSDVFNNIGVGNATNVVVTLVPRTPGTSISVGALKIQLQTT